MEFGAVEGHAVAQVGQGVEVAPGHLPHQPFAAELRQFVPDPGRGDLGRISAEALDQHGAELSVAEGLEREPSTAQGLQDSHRPRRAEPDAGDALPSIRGGSHDPLEGRAVEG